MVRSHQPSDSGSTMLQSNRFSGARWKSLLMIACGVVASASHLTAGDWLQFRGPNATGFAEGESLPTEIGADKNLAWHIPLPGKGPASPLVVDGKVIVCSSGGEGRQQDRVYVEAYSTTDGSKLWSRRFWSTGRPFSHPTSANAAPTPVCDGERIYAFFSSNDLACLTLEGDLVWYRGLTYDYPKAANDVGMASSPVIAGDVVVVQVENQGDSFVSGIDRLTGEPRWRAVREAEANWGSPVAYQVDGVDYVLVVSRVGATAYRASDGEIAWERAGAGSSVSSSVVLGDKLLMPFDGLLFVSASSMSTEDVWNNNRARPSNTSPVVWNDKAYLLSGQGVLAAVNLADGEVAWQERVGGSYWATPVIAGGHLYAVSSAGVVNVVRLDAEGAEVIGSYDLGEAALASPAVADGGLYIRTDSGLWKFAAE